MTTRLRIGRERVEKTRGKRHDAAERKSGILRQVRYGLEGVVAVEVVVGALDEDGEGKTEGTA
jgi:hypothetical protein